jgi:hypothetical protein
LANPGEWISLLHWVQSLSGVEQKDGTHIHKKIARDEIPILGLNFAAIFANWGDRDKAKIEEGTVPGAIIPTEMEEFGQKYFGEEIEPFKVNLVPSPSPTLFWSPMEYFKINWQLTDLAGIVFSGFGKTRTGKKLKTEWMERNNSGNPPYPFRFSLLFPFWNGGFELTKVCFFNP